MRRRVRVSNPRRSAPWARVFLFAILCAVALAPVVVVMKALRAWQRAGEGLPELATVGARAIEAPQTSVVVAADGTVLALQPFTDGEVVGDRAWVTFDAMPELLVHAILAAEDVRFEQHGGVDLRAVARAAWTNWRAGRTVEGASTLTQQAARLLMPADVGRQKNLERKLREAVIARRLERAWTKAQIFELWANEVYLGGGAYGVVAAARRTFGKSLGAMTLAETATIAGLAQAPATAHPFVDAAAAKARRDEVLARMSKAGFIDDAALAVALAEPLEGARPAGDANVAPWLAEAVRRELEARDPSLMRHGGLVVETTAVPLAGAAAEAALGRAVRALAQRQASTAPEGALVAIDHRTGTIEALVGGTTWAGNGFDRALQACRQPGSAFKPFVYAAAIAGGVLTPASTLLDAPITDWDPSYLSAWKPNNAGRAYRGPVIAADALASSLNPPAIHVFDRAGAPAVIETAQRLGITSELAPVRPLALGASCVKPFELARAYARLAVGGRGLEPRMITRIVRRVDGEVLFDAADPVEPWLDPARRLDRLAARAGERPPQAIDGAVAWIVEWMLGQVVTRGTGHDAAAIGRPAGGKTGTTNDAADAWFVGSTARLTAVVWVGHDKPAPLGKGEDGTHAALPAWVLAVRALEDGRPAEAVQGEAPEGVAWVERGGRRVPVPRGAEVEEDDVSAPSTGIDDAAKEF